MIPMGTIVTVTMFAGIATAMLHTKFLPAANKAVGFLLLAAGLWNVFWYGLQHMGQFWGIAALVSGLLMVITSMHILASSKLPTIVVKLKPIVLVLLLGCALKYAVTIVSL